MSITASGYFWTSLKKRQIYSIALFLICLCLILFAERAAISNLYTAWQTEEYSHGILIPFIAILLSWHQLTNARPKLKPSWWGVVCLLLAACLQLVTQLSAFDTTAEYAIVISIIGLVLCFTGREATWTILGALLYLLFAVPLPHLIQANLSQSLQLLSSTLGVWPLDFIGIPVYQEGNVIDLGGYRLQVVEACNGLRYLFPLMSFGYLAALLLKDAWWKRALIILSTIPITIGMNSLRIAFIGITVNIWGSQMAEGFIHSFEGWTIFLCCIAIIMFEIWLLLKVRPHGIFRYEYLGLAKGPLFSEFSNRNGPKIAAVIITIFLALFFGAKVISPTAEIVPTHKPLSSFDLSIEDWSGRIDSIPSDVLAALQLSDFWIANYKRPADPMPVGLYIAYYDSQRVGVTTHSPSNCIPGGGWAIDHSSVETILLSNGMRLKLTRLIIRKGGDAQIVYYWFDERGRDITETISAKWYLLVDSIKMHRSDGALVRVGTSIGPDENEARAESRLNAFLNVVYPKIKTFIPGGPEPILTSGVATPSLSR